MPQWLIRVNEAIQTRKIQMHGKSQSVRVQWEVRAWVEQAVYASVCVCLVSGNYRGFQKFHCTDADINCLLQVKDNTRTVISRRLYGNYECFIVFLPIPPFKYPD